MKTILVVEDEQAIAEMLALTLEEEGYRVLRAKNGREGLARMAEERPDLVLCDVMMPLLDGRGVAAAMHADAGLRSIPLVLMSAALLVDGGVPAGASAFLPKPLDIARLLNIIEQLTGSGG
jgi:two-component system, OmpR family, alkaline phosphatase synthesis response regulator PhoP